MVIVKSYRSDRIIHISEQCRLLCFWPQVDEVSGTITATNPGAEHGEPPKSYRFDTVFGTTSKQVDIYNRAARPICDNVLEGYNG